MKNRLLTLVALCAATASALPLWAAYPDDPALTFVSDDELGLDELMANPGTQKTFYMYHVATGKFLNDGNWKNNWNSEVVIADDGLAVTLSYGLDTHFGYLAEDDENYNPNMGFRLTTFEGHTNGNFHEIYLLNSSGVMCVDHNAQGRNIWKITKQDNGYYRISVGEGTPEFTEIGEYGDRCWAVEEGDNGVNGIMDMNAADYNNPQADWQFVAEDVYEVYNAKKNVLKPAIEEAEATPGVDCTAEKALYDKADATVEEITEAADALKAKVLEAKYSSASPQNPVDVSDLMANPKFDGNANGWTTEREADPTGQQDNWQYQGSTQNTSDGTTFAGFWERWNPNAPQVDWSVHQDLNNIPNGRYKLTAYVLTNKKADEGGPQGLYVYATSFGAETRSSEQPLGSPDGNGYASPISVEFDVINGAATVGFKAVDYNSNWAGVDNFKLEFLGAAAAETTARDLLKKAIEDANANLNTVGKTSRAGKTRFQEVVNLATQAQQNTEVADDSLLALSYQLIAEFDTLKVDADAYAELQTITKGMLEKMSDPDSPYNGMLIGTEYLNYYGELMVGYNAETFDPKEIGGVQAKADSLYTETIAALLTSGKTNNVTGMLVNPTFENNSASGWSGTSVSGWSGTVATAVKDGMLEMFDKNYDFYQEFTGLPAGTYEMTLQGFHRPGDNYNCQTAWGVEGDPYYEVEAYAYINDGLAELNHCYDHVTDTVVNGNDIALVVGDESINGKYAVNNLTSASMVLAHGDYPVTVKGYVGSDGVLRVGVKLENKQDDSWSAFGHFEIKYLGAADMSGANSTLNELIGLAQTLAADDALATADTRKALNDAVTAANNAVSGTLTEETYQSNTNALNEAMADFRDALAAAAALETKATNHASKLYGSGENSYEQYAGTEGYDELADLTEGILIDYVNKMMDFESVAQIEQYSTDIDRAYSKMVTADFDGTGASQEDASDATVFIVNPGFSVLLENQYGDIVEVPSADGWTTTGGMATDALNYEFYGGYSEDNKLADDANIKQTLYNMPAGYYRLMWNGFYCSAGTQDAAEARLERVNAGLEEEINAEVFVDNGENHWSQKLASIFDEVAERRYAGDGVILSDTLFPDKPEQIYYVVPSGVQAASAMFDEGLYEGNLVFHVAEGEAPTIGVRKIKTNLFDWTCFDNFRLEYLGIPDAADLVLDETETYGVASGTYADVAMRRTLDAGKWNTFCVPFNMTAEQLAANGITRVVGLAVDPASTEEGVNLVSTDVTEVKAGVPYLVQVERDVTALFVDGVYVTASEPAAQTIGTVGDYTVKMTGNYSAITLPAGAYFVSDNTFYVIGDGVTVNMKGFRAYLTLTDAAGRAVEANIRLVGLDGGTEGGGTTVIEGVAGGEADAPVDVYTLSGVKVKGGVKASGALDGLQRGIYIVNGKKIIK